MIQKKEIEKSFTFIEILVVVTIIGMLTTAASISYSQFMKQSRDAKRKADVENIQAALEMYRSNQSVGYYPVSLTILKPDYIMDIPSDPKTKLPYPTYSPEPPGCDNTTTYCTSYTIYASLENNNYYKANPYGATEMAIPTP
ncbi:MAG: type II secretion system protein [Microgenomates group bacterium]|nr:type II secretion system protein [Microgenomates group bacterium]